MYRAVVLVTLVGCYSPSYSNCSISCTDSCPNSLTCDSQLHVCRTVGTTCMGGDAGGGNDTGTGDASGAIDAGLDAPQDAAGGCTFVQSASGGQDGGNLTFDLSAAPIAQGDFVVVTIAGRGTANIGSVSDLNSHLFTKAITSQITAQGTETTSSIYYLFAAPVAMSMINVNWTNSVTQIVTISEWQCGSPPSAQTRVGMTNGTTGSTTDTGSLMPPARSLVVAALAGASNAGLVLQTPGFTLIDMVTQSGTSGATTNTSAWGVVDAGSNVDVTFSTLPGATFAATSAAFTVP